MSGRFQCDQQQGQPEKPDENSGDKGETAAQDFSPFLSGLLNKSENLERDHRQDARHQIENETAYETKDKETKVLLDVEFSLTLPFRSQPKSPRHCDAVRQRNFRKR